MTTTPAAPSLDFLQPAFASLLARVPHIGFVLQDRSAGVSHADWCPIAATDGRRVFVNAPALSAWSIKDVTFALAHEIVHIMLEHPWKIKRWAKLGACGVLPFTPEVNHDHRAIMNVALDYIVNDFCANSRVQVPKSVGDAGFFHDPSFIPWTMSEAEAYAKVWQKHAGKAPSQGRDGAGAGAGARARAGSGVPGAGGDDVLPAEADDTPAAAKRTTQRGLEMGRQRGTLPSGAERLIEDLDRPRYDFREVVPRFLKGRLGRNRATWSKPNRRQLATHGTVWPGRRGVSTGELVVTLDTSGSITREQLMGFCGALAQVVDQCLPRKVTVLDVDSKVHQARVVRSLADVQVIARDGVKGKGGTDMPATFRWCEENKVKPDACIILTDGYTPFSEDPGYPVLWVITTPSIEAPWGTTCHAWKEGLE
jgi:predicted metal-dependent peptidase